MNDLMIFEGHEVEVFDLDGKVLFNPYHVGECLELSDSAVRNYLAKMNEKQAIIIKNSDVRDKDIRKLNNAGEKFITESGVYKLVFKSRKPNAEAFTDWVTDEVLPAIRKTGSYQKPLTQQEMMRIQLGMIDNHEERILNLENNMTIDYGQQQVLGDAVNHAVLSALGGKESEAYKMIGKKVFAECNRDLKHFFHVNARNNVPKKRFDEAVEYAKEWKPCTNTILMIKEHNSQMSFGNIS